MREVEEHPCEEDGVGEELPEDGVVSVLVDEEVHEEAVGSQEVGVGDSLLEVEVVRGVGSLLVAVVRILSF